MAMAMIMCMVENMPRGPEKKKWVQREITLY